MAPNLSSRCELTLSKISRYLSLLAVSERYVTDNVIHFAFSEAKASYAKASPS